MSDLLVIPIAGVFGEWKCGELVKRDLSRSYKISGNFSLWTVEAIPFFRTCEESLPTMGSKVSCLACTSLKMHQTFYFKLFLFTDVSVGIIRGRRHVCYAAEMRSLIGQCSSSSFSDFSE